MSVIETKKDPPAEDKVVEKKPRQQLTNILNIGISQARCASHLKTNLSNKIVDDEIVALRKQLKDVKELDKASPTIETLKSTIANLSKLQIRISSDTPIAVAVFLDLMTRELLRHGMEQAIFDKRKIVEVAHLHCGDVSKLVYSPIFCKLPSYSQFDPAQEETIKAQRSANKTKSTEAPKEHGKVTFFTYIENVLKSVKKEEAYHSMRVSNRVRKHLSDLAAEGITRLALLARIIVQDVVGVRTMNAEHIKSVIHLLMADYGKSETEVQNLKDQIDDKLKIYHEHSKTEKEKKLSTMDSNTRAEFDRKKKENDVNRKKKQIEMVKKRAENATQKIAELEKETLLTDLIG